MTETMGGATITMTLGADERKEFERIGSLCGLGDPSDVVRQALTFFGFVVDRAYEGKEIHVVEGREAQQLVGEVLSRAAEKGLRDRTAPQGRGRLRLAASDGVSVSPVRLVVSDGG